MWIKCSDKSPPRDHVFLGVVKGTVCLCEFDDETMEFYICWFPAQHDPASAKWNNLDKLTYWMPLPEVPNVD